MNVTFDPRTVGPRIRMMLREMTPSEARITEILLRSAAEDSMPMKRLADEAGVSEAMVVKTAKRLGFAGYRELRAALLEYKRQPNVDLHQEVTPDDTAETIVQKVFRTSIQALEETLAILSMDAFLHAVELIHGAHQRDFYGLGGSAQIARDVSHKFLRIGVRTSVFDDTHMMAMSASLLRAGDVVIAFSHSGSTLGGPRRRADRPQQPRQHHCGDQLRILAARRTLRCGSVLDRAGLVPDQRKRRRAHRAAEHYGRGFHRRRPERLSGGGDKSDAHNVRCAGQAQIVTPNFGAKHHARRGFDVIVCGSLHLDIMVKGAPLPKLDETAVGSEWGMTLRRQGRQSGGYVREDGGPHRHDRTGWE